MSGFKPGLGFLKGISPYAGVFVFGVAFILFLNRLEKKLLSKGGISLYSVIALSGP